MKRNTLYIFSLVALLAGTLAGCKKALEVIPRDSAEATTALSTREGISAATTGAYARLKSLRVYGRDLIALPEALSDNGFATNKSGRLLNEANNVFGAHFTTELWRLSYIGINDINLMFDAIPKLQVVPAITPAEQASLEAPLYFLRGLYYLNLALAYSYIPGATVTAQDRGGVPIILTGTSTIEQAIALLPSRPAIGDVYTQIISDLTAAQTRLPTSLNAASFMNTANKYAAQALLSRVNLYIKNYSESKRWADSCIAAVGGRLTSGGNYVSNWRLPTHGETLFQLLFATNAENPGVNESLQTSFTTLVTPGVPTLTGGFGDLVPTISLLTDLGITLSTGTSAANFTSVNASITARSADVRNQLYEVGTTGRGKSYVECTKFIGKNGFINLDNIPVIRIAEVYLNRAEALATPGSSVLNETAALADLNTILAARGLPTVSLAGTALYNEILRQRRVELAFEGHRFWDLKRLSRDIVKAPHYNTVTFTDARILAAIPQREVDGNPNLRQNFGY